MSECRQIDQDRWPCKDCLSTKPEEEPRCELCRARRTSDLIEALSAVVRDVNDYERANNLAPNPGRSECWDSVARAKALLATYSLTSKPQGGE